MLRSVWAWFIILPLLPPERLGLFSFPNESNWLEWILTVFSNVDTIYVTAEIHSTAGPQPLTLSTCSLSSWSLPSAGPAPYWPRPPAPHLPSPLPVWATWSSSAPQELIAELQSDLQSCPVAGPSVPCLQAPNQGFTSASRLSSVPR